MKENAAFCVRATFSRASFGNSGRIQLALLVIVIRCHPVDSCGMFPEGFEHSNPRNSQRTTRKTDENVKKHVT